MQKNDVIKNGEQIIRILEVREDAVFVIDCARKTMPSWKRLSEVEIGQTLSEEDFIKEMRAAGDVRYPGEELTTEQKKTAHLRFTMVAGILPVLSDDKKR